MKRWSISIPIFNKEVIVLQSKDIQTIENYINDAYNCSFTGGESCCGATYTLPNGSIIIGLMNNDKSTVLHECCHAVFRIQDTINSTDEELFCYLVEYLYNHVCNMLTND